MQLNNIISLGEVSELKRANNDMAESPVQRPQRPDVIHHVAISLCRHSYTCRRFVCRRFELSPFRYDIVLLFACCICSLL